MIVSRQNQRLKDIRRLKASKGGRRALIEGPHLIAEALAAGLELDPVLVTSDFLHSEAGRRLVAALPAPPLEVAVPLLDKLADADSPRGALAVADLPRPGPTDLPKSLAAQTTLGVYAERIQDPGNLGALARAAEAAGAGALVLSPGTAHPNHPRALRGAAGSLFRLSTVTEASLAVLKAALAETVRFVALVPRGGTDLYELELEDPVWVVVGSEGTGLTPETVAGCDVEVTIPLAPPVESLNTTVAAAVVLFEIRRRRARS